MNYHKLEMTHAKDVKVRGNPAVAGQADGRSGGMQTLGQEGEEEHEEDEEEDLGDAKPWESKFVKLRQALSNPRIFSASRTGHHGVWRLGSGVRALSLIHISEPTRLGMISYAVFCLKKK